jgi:hypothetical protein
MAFEITSESLAGAQPQDPAVFKAGLPRPISGSPGVRKSPARSRFWPRSRWTRRNFSSRASELSGGDAIILSVPKSGRTWLRAFLCAYFCKRFGLQFTLRPGRYDIPGFPRVVFSHDLFEHRTKGDRWDRVRGKYLVPRSELARAKIILLARDPRDCFVSLYLQLTRRDPHAPTELRRYSANQRPTRRCLNTRSSFPVSRICNNWKLRARSIPKSCIRATCATRNRSKSAAEKSAAITNISRLKISNVLPSY